MSTMQLPVLSSEGNLSFYLQEIKKFPILTAEEEYMLAKRFHDHGDTEAAHKLVTSHLRLVAKIAKGYRGYGLPITDLISEGNLGIMRAVKKFDPDKGFVRVKGDVVKGLQNRREKEEDLFEEIIEEPKKESDSLDVGIEDTLVDDWTSQTSIIE